jgi:plasmid maintenance system antidote protein VapI
MDVHTDEVKNVLWAELPVTEEFAEGLSRAFGTSKEMWLNLQKQFDESE